MLDSIDQLDLASLALTRVAAFSARGVPSGEEIESWLDSRNPRWRSGSQDGGLLAEVASSGIVAGSYGIPALRAAAERLVRRGESGWELVASPTATAIMRWRLPLGTVHAAAAAAAKEAEPGSPPCPIAYKDFLKQLQETGAVDGHVHVGTCLPFDGLFQILQDQVVVPRPPAARDQPALVFEDSSKVTFDPADLLVYARMLGILLDGFLASGTDDFGSYLESAGIPPEFLAALRAGDGWRFVGEVDPAGITESARRIDVPGRLLGDIANDRSGAGGDPYRTGIVRKLELLRRCFYESTCPLYTSAVEDILRCEALLHTALIQGNRAGLSEFLIRAKRLGKLRESVPDRTRAVIRDGLPYLADGMSLKGIELRTAEQNDEHESIEKLAKSLDGQLAGFEEAMGRIDDGNRPVGTWTICLIKSSKMVADCDDPSPPGAASPRFDLAEIFSLIELTAKLFARFPASRRLFSGFDVAGDENAVPSWCFSLVFEELLTRLRSGPTLTDKPGELSFRVHAGEDFHSPLQGLRRIDEAIRWVVPDEYRPRIGHGLALTHSPNGLTGQNLAEQPKDEAFDDLVWAWSRLERSDEVGNRDLVKILEEAIVQEGRRLYGINGASPADYWSAYAKRFDPASLRAIGLLKQSTHKDGHALAQTLPDLATTTPLSERILFEYMTRRDLRLPCVTPLLDPVWMANAIDGTRHLVRKLVAERSAVIEVCPTSNLVIGGLDDYLRHPFHGWLEDEIDVTVNTDDPGLFSVTLRDEYGYLWASSSGAPDQRLASFREIQERSCGLIGSCDNPAQNAELIAEVRTEWADVVGPKGPRLA